MICSHEFVLICCMVQEGMSVHVAFGCVCKCMLMLHAGCVCCLNYIFNRASHDNASGVTLLHRRAWTFAFPANLPQALQDNLCRKRTLFH